MEKRVTRSANIQFQSKGNQGHEATSSDRQLAYLRELGFLSSKSGLQSLWENDFQARFEVEMAELEKRVEA